MFLFATYLDNYHFNALFTFPRQLGYRLVSTSTVTQLSGYNSVRCLRLPLEEFNRTISSFIVLLSPQLLRIVVLCLCPMAQFSTLPLPAARSPPTPVHWDSFWRGWGLGHVRPQGHCVQDCGQGVPPDVDVSEVCMELELARLVPCKEFSNQREEFISK